MMAHNNYHQMMSLALDGELSSSDRTILDSHLLTCLACQSTWDEMSGLDVLLSGTALVGPARGFTAGVMAKLASQQARRRTESIFWIGVMTLVAIAMLSQWASGLAPVAANVSLPMLPEPLNGLAELAAPLLNTLATLGALVGTLLEAGRLWLAYVSALPVVWTATLAALALAATWVGLLGVFGPAQESIPAAEAVRSW